MEQDTDVLCPRCRAALPAAVGNRFGAWCPACDWNLVPDGGAGVSKATARASARHERTFRRVVAGAAGAGLPPAAQCAAVLLASAVNLATVALAATGVWLLLAGTWPQRILGAVVLLVALALRPRVRRMPGHVLDRAAAPTLYALTERVAAELRTRPVDVIAVDAGYGSRCTTAGWRRRRVLVVGLPLWETLTTDQRLALLGHDLGRAAAAETLAAAWIRTALDALTVWADIVRPASQVDDARQGVTDGYAFDSASVGIRQVGMINEGAALARPLQDALAHGALLLHRLLSRLNERSGGRTEYRADENAARVASAAAADGLLHALLLRETALFALERCARSEGDLWAGLRERLASVPDTERERRLRLSRLRGDASDVGCPPTWLRIRFVRGLPCTDAAVTVRHDEARAVDVELRPARAVIAAEVRERP